VRNDGNTWFGVPDDDTVSCDARHQNPVSISGNADGRGRGNLRNSELTRPTHRIIHDEMME